MFCGISGETPLEPVFNTKSGTLYEKRLAVKYVQDNGKDPVTGVECTVEDLVEVKTALPSARPRPPAATSVPSLLSLLQSEWDSSMLETFQLKRQHSQLRQELSNALYENDAAKRVIARLVKERDEARRALANVKAQFGAVGVTAASAGTGGGGDAMDVDEGITAEMVESMTRVSQELSKTRRKRKPPTTLAASTAFPSYTSSSLPLAPKASKSPIAALDVLLPTNHVLSGHASGLITVHDAVSGKLAGHSAGAHRGGVTSVAWNAAMAASGTPTFLSGGKDKTVKIWSLDEAGAPVGKFSVKDACKDEVVGVCAHAGGEYWVAVGGDGEWVFGEVASGRVVRRVRGEDVSAYTAATLHPDGLILATSTPTSVLLWDVKSQSIAATFACPAGAHSVSFSENGYHMASLGGDGVVKMWDLRKLAAGKEVKVEGLGGKGAVCFDYSGQYAAVGGDGEVKIYSGKTWDYITSLSDAGAAAGVRFGEDAKCVVAGGAEGVVKVWKGEE